MIKIIIIICLYCIAFLSHATEYKIHGIVDLRASTADSLTSYTDGGHGKLSNNDGEEISLGQAGAELTIEWESGLSAHFVANAYLNKNESALGLTEGFLKYRSLPNDSGYRWQTKAGIFYPEISLENNAFAWASKNTLNSSAINTWIGEEIRVLGSELAVTRLGKFNNAPYDITVAATAFVNNDPAGSLLSWHGWTIGNRQTLWTESRKIPWFKARKHGYSLYGQAAKSDPFLELDDTVGFHLRAKTKWHKKGEFSAGYYDNQGKPYIVENGQYAWRTRFFHMGAVWLLPNNYHLSAQYLDGDTLMQSAARVDIVDNSYSSGYIALNKRWQKHRVTGRIEEFSVDDHDETVGDNNNEYGKSFTLNYSYRLAKSWFLSSEYTWIQSRRMARWYVQEPINLTERQLQFAARYFF